MADRNPPFMRSYVVELSSIGEVLNSDNFLRLRKPRSTGNKIDGLHPYFYSDLIDSYYSYILSGDYHYHRSCFIASGDDNYNNKKRIMGEGKLQIHRDIEAEIISCLPTRSIVRFGSVCKDWYAMSHDPIVALAQFSHTTATNNLHHHLLIYPGRPLPNVHLIQCNKGGSGIGAHTVFELKPLARNMMVIGSSNGILCLIDHHNDGEDIPIYLYNPLLGDYLQLPNPSNNDNYEGIIKYGFGFDNARLEFKAVRYVTSNDDQIQVLEVCVIPIEGNVTPQPWKAKKFQLYMDEPLYTDEPPDTYMDELTYLGEPLILLDGKLHCLTKNQYEEQFILSFDIASEEITLIPLLVRTFSWRPHIARIGELGGSLFAVPAYIVPNEMFEVYVLMDYGDPKSWTNLLDLCGPGENMVPYMWNEQRILLRDLNYKGEEWIEPYIVHHTPTLVSLKPNQNLM